MKTGFSFPNPCHSSSDHHLESIFIGLTLNLGLNDEKIPRFCFKNSTSLGKILLAVSIFRYLDRKHSNLDSPNRHLGSPIPHLGSPKAYLGFLIPHLGSPNSHLGSQN
jgi:hypothetical protein